VRVAYLDGGPITRQSRPLNKVDLMLLLVNSMGRQQATNSQKLVIFRRKAGEVTFEKVATIVRCLELTAKVLDK